MKKFVGYVNGESFDNEKDFNEAANKAIEKNDGTLSISSYYSYTNDDDRKLLEDEKDDKFVSTNEYFLGETKPIDVDTDSVRYEVPEKLKNRLEEATNKDGIKKNLNYHITKLDNIIDDGERNIKKIQDDIEKLQDKLYEKVNAVKDLKGKKEYYDNLLTIVDVDKDKKDGEKESNQVTKERIRDVLGISPDMSLYSFLKQLGLLK